MTSRSTTQTASSINHKPTTTTTTTTPSQSSSSPDAAWIPITQTTAFKVGIGIAVAICILALLTGIALCLYRKRRRNQYRDPNANIGGPYGSDEVIVPSFRTPIEMRSSAAMSMATSRPPSYPDDDDWAWSGGAARSRTASSNLVNGDVGESSTGAGTASFSRSGAARKYAGMGRDYKRGQGYSSVPSGGARPVSTIPEEESLYSIPYETLG
jgi:hypothetical protein